MATLVQPAGFVVLLPFLCISPPRVQTTDSNNTKAPSALTLASIYASFGVVLAGDSMLFAVGLLYLPACTFSLICASQLGFNALFSFNSQKFTPFIINSLILLTISPNLLVFHTDSSGSAEVSKGKYTTCFLGTAGAAAGYALMLSAAQLFYQKILKRADLRVILEMIIYESLVATCAIQVGLFTSREWKGLKEEMDEFGLGKLSYVMTLVWTSISWQVLSIGAVGLIFKVSSLFCNVISTLSFPIVLVSAVIFFHDKMNGVKAIAMLLAIWGFVSYIYQHYLDDFKSKTESGSAVPEVSSIEEVSQ